MKNIEIKTPLANRNAIEERLRSINARHEWTRRQVDTFFAAPNGWLKLREVEDHPAELISYRRSKEDSGPRESDYDVIRLEEKVELEALLERALGILGKVEKERALWLWRDTRIHLDRVKGLGDFIELETVLANISAEEGKAENEEMIGLLALERARFISVPYLELPRRQ